MSFRPSLLPATVVSLWKLTEKGDVLMAYTATDDSAAFETNYYLRKATSVLVHGVFVRGPDPKPGLTCAKPFCRLSKTLDFAYSN